jgi:hypothetical protein
LIRLASHRLPRRADVLRDIDPRPAVLVRVWLTIHPQDFLD